MINATVTSFFSLDAHAPQFIPWRGNEVDLHVWGTAAIFQTLHDERLAPHALRLRRLNRHLLVLAGCSKILQQLWNCLVGNRESVPRAGVMASTRTSSAKAAGLATLSLESLDPLYPKSNAPSSASGLISARLD